MDRDEAALAAYERLRQQEVATHQMQYGESVICDGATAALFTDDLTPAARHALKRALVAQGRATWLIARGVTADG